MHIFPVSCQLDICQVVIIRLYSTVHMTIITYVHTLGKSQEA
jgi:hypothetical protein